MSDTTIKIKWDGVEYAFPGGLTPAESLLVRKWTDGALDGGVAWFKAVEGMDPVAIVAAIVIAQRRLGIDADFDAYMDTDIWGGGLEVIAPDGDDDVPPTSEPSETLGQVSTSTPDGTGDQS